MADDDRLSILKNLLLMSFVNSPVKIILEFIESHVESISTDLDEEADTFIGQLLSKKAILKKNMESKNTLIHVLALDGTVESVSQLLKYGANVNAKNEAGKTPMFYAIRNSVEMVKLLLDDSKVNYWDLFRQALLYGTEEMLELLLRKSLLDEMQNDSAQGAMSTNYEVDKFPDTETLINAFLQHQLHLSNSGESYPPLIFFAARISRKDILHTILDDCRKNLESIRQKKIEENVEIIYESRAPKELNVQGLLHETALHHAVVHRHVEAARFLLEEGADPNCQDRKKLTPLHIASYLEDEEICQLLLSFGANANPNFDFPPNPLNLVCGCTKGEDCINLNDYKDETEYCHDNFRNFNPQIMKLLLRNGANPDISYKVYTSPLFTASAEGRVGEVKILLEYGANIQVVDDCSRDSALHEAVQFSESLEVVEVLLEKGLDIDLKNKHNITPLMYAIENSLDMIKYLVDRGANINAMAVDGGTALFYAIENCLFDGDVEFLLESGADWSILDRKQTPFCFGEQDRCVHRKLKVLISFTALTENELNFPFELYLQCTDEEHVQEALNYFQKSKLEITKLKTTTTSKDVKSSCFDFLTKDFYTSVQIAKNTDLKIFFHSDGYKKEFPCYQSLLKYRFEMTQDLESVVDQTFNFVSKYTNLLPEIVKIIMSHLRAKDFRIFGRVLLNKRF